MTRRACVVLLLAVAGLSACTYRVRESNVVIARVAPAVDMPALRAAVPGHAIVESRIATADGASLQAVRMLRPDAVATVLYLGGNGYTIGRFAAATARRFADLPVNLVLVDHRGYGGSTGTASIGALMADAVVVHDHLRADPALADVPLVVHGHSLGSFMAGHLATQRQLGGLVLEGSVTRTEDWTMHLRSQQSAWIRMLVWRVLPDAALAGRGNLAVMPSLDEPVLVVTGADDAVAPPRFAQALFDATPASGAGRTLLVVPGHGHMDAADSDEFREAMRTFVGRVSAPSAIQGPRAAP